MGPFRVSQILQDPCKFKFNASACKGVCWLFKRKIFGGENNNEMFFDMILYGLKHQNQRKLSPNQLGRIRQMPKKCDTKHSIPLRIGVVGAFSCFTNPSLLMLITVLGPNPKVGAYRYGVSVRLSVIAFLYGP